jgi:hypothetical protein
MKDPQKTRSVPPRFVKWCLSRLLLLHISCVCLAGQVDFCRRLFTRAFGLVSFPLHLDIPKTQAVTCIVHINEMVNDQCILLSKSELLEDFTFLCKS